MNEDQLLDLHNSYWRDYFPFSASYQDHRYMDVLLVSSLPFESVLEVGTGNGDGLKKLITAGKKAKGLEYSQFLYENLLREKFPNGEVVNGDAAYLPFEDNSFDMICSFDVLEHLPEKKARHAVKEIYRVTKKFFFGTISNRVDHYERFHLTIQPHAWWVDRFTELGFKDRGQRELHVYEK